MISANNPELSSFVDVPENSDFPIQNLPWGVFRSKALPTAKPNVGVAIGTMVLNVTVLEQKKLIQTPFALFQEGTLNLLMEQEPQVWSDIREQLSRLLRSDCPTLRDDQKLMDETLISQETVSMLLPAKIGDYTDFYSSREHATNVGTMFRDKNNPLLPNWLHLPVGYHGRASSVVVSGTDIVRPKGQIMPPDAEAPIHAPCGRLDFELEMAFFVGGKGNRQGTTISVSDAENHIFGLVLMNDWSARDIQKWEYQPLGPFVSKSFATTISPWIVPYEALKPFAEEGAVQEPKPLEYLKIPKGTKQHFAIELQVGLKNPESQKTDQLCTSNSRHLYWSMCQQLAHHTVTGCNVKAGDLMASGTISGTKEGSYGSLLELSWGGQKPLTLSDGQKRTFLEDGDEVIMQARAQGTGYRIGFGSCAGKILPQNS